MGFAYQRNPETNVTPCDADIQLVKDFIFMWNYFDVYERGKSITPGLLQHATKLSQQYLREDNFQSEITRKEFQRIYKALKIEADAETHAKQNNISSSYYDWTDTMEKLWGGELFEFRKKLVEMNEEAYRNA
jgi:hypothetical protein